MSKFYKDGAFYDTEINIDSIPDDAVEITNEYWQTLLSGQGQGQLIQPDDNGYPVLVTPDKTQAQIIAEYENAVQSHIDTVAKNNDFDSILTCTKYAGFDNQFRAHAEALLAWNANCWINCHIILDAVIAGERQPPTIAELLAELPAFVWNVTT